MLVSIFNLLCDMPSSYPMRTPLTAAFPVITLGGGPLGDSARYRGCLEVPWDCHFTNKPRYTVHLGDCPCCLVCSGFSCEANFGTEFFLIPDHVSLVTVALTCHTSPSYSLLYRQQRGLCPWRKNQARLTWEKDKKSPMNSMLGS